MQKILPSNATLIPDNATRVFTGTIFDVYQWPQRMFDGSTQTFEMLKRPDTALTLLVRGTQLLLVKDEQPGRSPVIDIPQGRVAQEDISWEAAAQRELLEETGFRCVHWRLILVEQPFTKLEWFTPLYLANGIVEESAQQLDPGGEKIELIWRDFHEAREMILSGSEPNMSYLVPLFNRIKTIDELLTLPAFIGTPIDR